MKIVVVDHVFLEKEHAERLRALGDLKVFGDPPKNEDELKERIDSAEIVVVGFLSIVLQQQLLGCWRRVWNFMCY